MKAESAGVGARVVDSLPFSQSGTETQAKALKANGVDGLAGYLGAMNAARLNYLMSAGLGYTPVTFGNVLTHQTPGTGSVKLCQALALPHGIHVWLDLEGTDVFNTAPSILIGKVNDWANCIEDAGYIPVLYVGVPQPLTSDELWKLHVRGYWRGQGSIRDRANALAEPACGWMMTQAWPSHNRAGVWVDDNQAGWDYRKRGLIWVIA